MRITFLYLTLSCLLALSTATWSTPVLLRRDQEWNSPSMCVDLKSNITYVVYGVTKREADPQSFLCYRAISIQDTISDEVCIKQDRIIENVTVACAHNGKHVHVAYAARRVKEEKDCSLNGRGCFDIYLTETDNAGKTWTKPVPVPRLNMSDMIHRTDPKLLLIQETGRLFIAFTKMYPEDNKFFLATATRPKDSQIFSNEDEMDAQWGRPLVNKTFSYIMIKKKPQLNIIFEPIGYCFQRRYSIDNGKTWKVDCIASGANVLYSMAMSQHKDRIYAVYGGSTSYTLRVTWLTPENKWEGRLLNNEQSVLDPIVADVATSVPLVLLSGYITVYNVR